MAENEGTLTTENTTPDTTEPIHTAREKQLEEQVSQLLTENENLRTINSQLYMHQSAEPPKTLDQKIDEAMLNFVKSNYDPRILHEVN